MRLQIKNVKYTEEFHFGEDIWHLVQPSKKEVEFPYREREKGVMEVKMRNRMGRIQWIDWTTIVKVLDKPI